MVSGSAVPAAAATVARAPFFNGFVRIALALGACHDARVAASPVSRDETRAGPAIRRVVASGCVAGGLGLVLRLVFYIGSRSHLTGGGTCGGGPWGCLFVAIIGVLAGILVIFVVAWPLMHVAGVRPAWPVALLGPVVAIMTYGAFVKLTDQPLLTDLWIVLAVSYAAAAVITAPRVYRYGSAAVAMAVVALDLATRFLVGR
jgi:hypothetical protein